MALFPGFDSAQADDPRKKDPASGASSNLSGSIASSPTEGSLIAPKWVSITPQSTSFEVIQNLIEVMTAYPNPYKMLGESLKIVAAFLDAEYIVLFEADTQNHLLMPLRPVYCALSDDDTNTLAELEALRLTPEDTSLSLEAYQQGKTLFANQTDIRLTTNPDRHKTFRHKNVLSSSLRLGKEVAGVLCALNKRDGDFGPPDVARLESLASTLAILLKNVQLSRQNEHQARRHQAVVEAAVDGFIEVNRDMRIIQFSKGAELLTGWQVSDALGHTCQEVLQPHSPENEPLCTNCPLRRSFHSGNSVSNVETLIRNQEGEDNWVSCSYNSVTDERGQVRSGIIAIKDIYRLKALSDELRQQSQQQESLIGVNNAINGLSNIEDIFRVSLDTISRAIDFDLGTIHSLDPNTNELNLMALLEKESSKVGQAVSIEPVESDQGGQGRVLENEEYQRQVRFRQYRADSPTNQARDGRVLNLKLKPHYAHHCEALRQNEPYLAVNLPDAPVCEVINDFEGLQSHICVPIKTHERNYGVLHLASRRPYAFWGSDFVLALSVCKQIAVGAERARLFEQIDRLARTDPLTGLYNKRELWERLDQEVRRAERHESLLSLVLVDLDRLKWINDYFGHAQGDALLMQLSELIRQQCRASDVAFRYGGDELCIMLPDTTQLEAKSVADRLRKAARAIHLGLDNDPVILGSDTLVTMSVGIASYPADGLNPAQLFESADAAMYRAKETGKDRAVIFDRQIDQHRMMRHRHLPDQDDRLTPPRRAGSSSLPPH